MSFAPPDDDVSHVHTMYIPCKYHGTHIKMNIKEDFGKICVLRRSVAILIYL